MQKTKQSLLSRQGDTQLNKQQNKEFNKQSNKKFLVKISYITLFSSSVMAFLFVTVFTIYEVIYSDNKSSNQSLKEQAKSFTSDDDNFLNGKQPNNDDLNLAQLNHDVSNSQTLDISLNASISNGAYENANQPLSSLKSPALNQKDDNKNTKNDALITYDSSMSSSGIEPNYVDVSLWEYDPQAKWESENDIANNSQYNSSQKTAYEIDEEYYAYVDLEAAQSLNTSDSFSFVSNDGEKTQVILAYDRSSSSTNYAGDVGFEKKWILTDENGQSIGRLAVSEYRLNAEYKADSGREFIAQADKNTGWVIPKKVLVEKIETTRPQDLSIAAVGNTDHPDYGRPESSNNEDDTSSPDFTYSENYR